MSPHDLSSPPFTLLFLLLIAEPLVRDRSPPPRNLRSLTPPETLRGLTVFPKSYRPVFPAKLRRLTFFGSSPVPKVCTRLRVHFSGVPRTSNLFLGFFSPPCRSSEFPRLPPAFLGFGIRSFVSLPPVLSSSAALSPFPLPERPVSLTLVSPKRSTLFTRS